MGGDVAPPLRSGDLGGAGRGIRGDHAEHAAVREQLVTAVERSDRILEVLDQVGEHDHVEAALAGVEALERHLLDVEPERLAGMPGGVGRQLEARGLVAALPRLVQEHAVAAAHIQKGPVRHVAPDLVEQPAGRRAPPLLLDEVIGVAHVAVQLVERVAAGQRGLLHGRALAAHVEVAVLAGAVVGRREALGRRSARRTAEAQLQRP